MKKIITALISVLAIAVISIFTLFAKNPAGINYAPLTGDTPWEIIILIGLVVVAVGIFVFLGTRKKK